MGASFAFSPTPPVAFPGGPLESAGLHLYRTDFGLQIAFLLGVINYVLLVSGSRQGVGRCERIDICGEDDAMDLLAVLVSAAAVPPFHTLWTSIQRPPLQDAAERGRLGASTFRNLNYGSAAASALISGSTL